MPSLARSASPLPSRSTPQPQRIRNTPTRMKAHSNTPGIITLPQPKTGELSSPNSNPRHPSSGSSPARPPATTLSATDASHVKDQEGRRRRRAKQNRSESPLKPSAADAEALLALGDDAAPTATDTPTKARRRRGGRANRQASPPLPEANSVLAPTVFPSTTPPQSDYDPLSHDHSRSVPPDPVILHNVPSRARFPEPQSSGDEWEMPAVPKQGAQDKPKENLSWQQELLRSGSTGSRPSQPRGNESPASRPRSRVNGQNAHTTGSTSSAASTGGKTRPALHHASISETGTAAGGPSLNWQQELLLQTADLSTLHQPSPVKPAAPGSLMTPGRARRYQAKDSITFGLGDLDLEDDVLLVDDVFASPGRGGRGQPPHMMGGSQLSSRRSTNPSSVAATGLSTPTRPQAQQSQQLAQMATLPVESRYAGPTFHNSPAPSSLPVPSFMLRKQAPPTSVAA
ncbi:hypothetical protein JCM10213_006813 [Rhodosporidiobolus nylandii]